MKKPTVLIILDGLGLRESSIGNAVKSAEMPNFDLLQSKYLSTKLQASGLAVGLPEGQMGNSEVGHLNIGAGRVVYQELTRISKEIREGNFEKKEEFIKAIENAKMNNKKLHLLGLTSDGGVHSHLEHLYALLKLAKQKGLSKEKVVVHCFLDGRDTPPRSAITYIAELEKKIGEIGVGVIATVSGRYYAMDRDKRWDRVEKAFNALVHGKGRRVNNALEAVKNAYEAGENDEFVIPTVIETDTNLAIEHGDSVIFYNFRPDRAREITRALVDKDFSDFDRKSSDLALHYVTMTVYDASIKNVNVAYRAEKLENTLGEYLSNLGMKQLRIAETEKYAHVTYFFNGGIEEPNRNEVRKLISSPKVDTYDLKPEMSAYEVTDELLKEIRKDEHDFIVVNFANPDMVGHTGVFDATVKALEVVDECLGKVIDMVVAKDGKAIVISDHGNSEQLINEDTNEVMTAHTTNLVPCILVAEGEYMLREDGKLCDLAPTFLELMDIDVPKEMTGLSLLKR
ncbi:2,3-bisphosphoglycerate-independent phosphoglycerate mutase [bacterium AH-315-G05]|nr:2,3-bisphosphoglycerate-independent phosphoglycerate mutase [bacterium AH-315-G05]